MGQQDPGKDPTPEQIEILCNEIKKNWTEVEEKKRAGFYGHSPVELPFVSTECLTGKKELDL